MATNQSKNPSAQKLLKSQHCMQEVAKHLSNHEIMELNLVSR